MTLLQVSRADQGYYLCRTSTVRSEFNLEKDLRQGDPLSQFLYLLVAEGLSLLISKATKENLYKAAAIGKDKIQISHLQYAGDTIFIGTGSNQNAWAMRRILRTALGFEDKIQ